MYDWTDGSICLYNEDDSDSFLSIFVEWHRLFCPALYCDLLGLLPGRTTESATVYRRSRCGQNCSKGTTKTLDAWKAIDALKINFIWNDLAYFLYEIITSLYALVTSWCTLLKSSIYTVITSGLPVVELLDYILF